MQVSVDNIFVNVYRVGCSIYLGLKKSNIADSRTGAYLQVRRPQGWSQWSRLPGGQIGAWGDDSGNGGPVLSEPGRAWAAQRVKTWKKISVRSGDDLDQIYGRCFPKGKEFDCWELPALVGIHSIITRAGNGDEGNLEERGKKQREWDWRKKQKDWGVCAGGSWWRLGGAGLHRPLAPRDLQCIATLLQPLQPNYEIAATGKIKWKMGMLRIVENCQRSERVWLVTLDVFFGTIAWVGWVALLGLVPLYNLKTPTLC